jgi:hypothetical protein
LIKMVGGEAQDCTICNTKVLHNELPQLSWGWNNTCMLSRSSMIMAWVTLRVKLCLHNFAKYFGHCEVQSCVTSFWSPQPSWSLMIRISLRLCIVYWYAGQSSKKPKNDKKLWSKSKQLCDGIQNYKWAPAHLFVK